MRMQVSTRSQAAMSTTGHALCVTTVPKVGANSYWLGATSRWRVRSGMPSLKHFSWMACMHASAGVASDSGAM
jgi:hypothetical protein